MSYPFNIASDLSIAQLFLIFLSIVISVIAGLLSLFLHSIFKIKTSIILFKPINAVAIIGISGYTIYYFKRWLIFTFNVRPFFVSPEILLLITLSAAFILIALLNKYVTAVAAKKEMSKLFKGVIASVIISLVILSSKTVTYIFRGNHSNLININVSHKSETVNQVVNFNANDISKRLSNIILVTFDSLSAEDMSLYGYRNNTTPNIDALAKQSYVFNNMTANANWTRPSAASIINGKYPSTHRIFNVNYSTEKMRYDYENLAHILREKGYKTAAITSNFRTHPLQNLTYLDFDYLPNTVRDWSRLLPIEKIMSFLPSNIVTQSNFIVLIDGIFSPLEKMQFFLWLKHDTETPDRPGLVFDNALDFIINAREPFFVWIHIMPPHLPYLPPNKFKYKLLSERIFNNSEDELVFISKRKKQYPTDEQFIVDKLRYRYNEFIMYADDEFGKFMTSLSTKDVYKKSILIVSSDHGESFRKGYLAHGGYHIGNLYQPFIRIPLVVHTPEQKIGKMIKSNGEQVDIAPTILDLLNMKIPGWMEGESLKPSMFYNQLTKKPKYSMAIFTKDENQQILKGAIAVIRGDYKYIFQIDENRAELYNINNDPNENMNLVNAERNIAAELKQLATRIIH